MLKRLDNKKVLLRLILSALLNGAVEPLLDGLKVKQELLRRGLRQGRSDSMVHFVLILASALENVLSSFRRRNFGIVIDGLCLCLINYADDFIFFARDLIQLKTMLSEVSLAP